MIKMFNPTLIFTHLQYIHLLASNKCSENIESVVPFMIYSFKKGLHLRIWKFLKSCLVAIIYGDSNLSQMYL